MINHVTGRAFAPTGMRGSSVADGLHGLYFEELREGQIFETAPYTVSRSEILSFAGAFDPNPFHLEDDAARSIGLPGVIASGFHVLSLSFRLFFELHLWDEAIMPSPGLDKVRWIRPVLPGQTIRVRATVTETTRSRSKPDRGIVRLVHETLDTKSNDAILSAEAMHRLRRRSVAVGGRPR